MWAALLAIGLAGSPETSRGAERLVAIATGSEDGVYYVAGSTICRWVNERRPDTGVKCHVVSTRGSLENLDLLRSGEVQFGIVQSDWLFHAYEGSQVFSTRGPFADLRTVLSLHPEAFTVAARADSGIRHFEDLKGRRVNVGNRGSGQRATFELLLSVMGWSTSDFGLAAEFKPSEQAEALCRGEIEAFVFVVGHPNESVKKATDGCRVELIEISGPPIDRVVAANKSYTYHTIPGGLYRGNPVGIKTFAVTAVVATTARVPEDLVYTVVEAVLDEPESFHRDDRNTADTGGTKIVREGLSAPLHPGAAKYYEKWKVP